MPNDDDDDDDDDGLFITGLPTNILQKSYFFIPAACKSHNTMSSRIMKSLDL